MGLSLKGVGTTLTEGVQLLGAGPSVLKCDVEGAECRGIAPFGVRLVPFRSDGGQGVGGARGGGGGTGWVETRRLRLLVALFARHVFVV